MMIIGGGRAGGRAAGGDERVEGARWGWLGGAGEGGGRCAQLDVLEVLFHLRVRHVLVDDDAAHELRVLEAAAHLAVHLDQVEVDVLPLHVRHGQHGVHLG